MNILSQGRPKARDVRISFKSNRERNPYSHRWAARAVSLIPLVLPQIFIYTALTTNSAYSTFLGCDRNEQNTTYGKLFAQLS